MAGRFTGPRTLGAIDLARGCKQVFSPLKRGPSVLGQAVEVLEAKVTSTRSPTSATVAGCRSPRTTSHPPVSRCTRFFSGLRLCSRCPAGQPGEEKRFATALERRSGARGRGRVCSDRPPRRRSRSIAPVLPRDEIRSHPSVVELPPLQRRWRPDLPGRADPRTGSSPTRPKGSPRAPSGLCLWGGRLLASASWKSSSSARPSGAGDSIRRPTASCASAGPNARIPAASWVLTSRAHTRAPAVATHSSVRERSSSPGRVGPPSRDPSQPRRSSPFTTSPTACSGRKFAVRAATVTSDTSSRTDHPPRASATA